MTIVCAYRSACGEIWLGADTRVSSEGFIYPVRLAKWERLGRWALAMTGSQTVQDLACRLSGKIIECGVAIEVARCLHDGMREAGWEPQENKGGIACFNTNGILASADGVWLVSGSGVVDVPSWGFAAAGSGEDFAWGAAYVAHRMRHPPDVVVRNAVEAAIEFRSDCGGDVIVERF